MSPAVYCVVTTIYSWSTILTSGFSVTRNVRKTNALHDIMHLNSFHNVWECKTELGIMAYHALFYVLSV